MLFSFEFRELVVDTSLFADSLFGPADPFLNFAILFLRFPETSRLGSFVAFPISSLIFPFTSWSLPAVRSWVLGFMTFACLSDFGLSP